MRLVIQSLLVILIMSMATFTLAADPEPQKPTDPPVRDEGQITPAIDIDQAGSKPGLLRMTLRFSSPSRDRRRQRR